MTDGFPGVPCLMLFLILAAIAQSGTSVGTKASTVPGEAQKHFERGKKLIEDNCIDCMGGNQAGLEGGIREIEAALQAGYRDQKAAYTLLSGAYAEMTTYTEKNQEEAKAYRKKLVQTDCKLFQLDPNDPEILERYANTLENDSDKIEILRRLLKIKPQPSAKYVLGNLLLKQRKVNEGLPLVRSAIETESDAESVVTYVMGLLGHLDEAGCPLAGAEEWQQKIHTAFDRAMNGAGDINALPGFKKAFLAALDQNKCAGR